MIISIVLFLLTFFSVQAEFLPLPRIYDSKAIFYVRAYQLDDFCCGYNALYNACNLERLYDFPNQLSDYSLFQGTCMRYLQREGIHPLSAVTNKTLEWLAKNYLHMQPIYHLMINKQNHIEPLFTTSTRVTFIEGTSRSQVDRMLDSAHRKRGEELIKNMKQEFAQKPGHCKMAHFICAIKVDGTGHWILMTLIYNRTGKALFIFDNMNLKIAETSQARRYIDFIIQHFGVSSKMHFKGPLMPECWPTTPVHAIDYYW